MCFRGVTLKTVSIFKARYLSDAEIWQLIDKVFEERNQIHELLAKPEVSTDPARLPELARQLHELDHICLLADQLSSDQNDLVQLEEMLAHSAGDEDELQELYQEYLSLCQGKAGQIYQLLLARGDLNFELEDQTDLEILKFIEYAGPEYAWRLGINIGIDVSEARERLDALLTKGLLERVQGTMLENYHRARDWTKHMNHTYYRLSREGKHYLRNLRK